MLNTKIALWALVSCIGAGAAARADSILVLNSEEASYSILSRSQRTEIQRFPIGREPHHLIVTPDGKEVLIASTVTNELVALDVKTGERKRVVRDIVDPYQLGYSANGKWFVTAAYRLDHVDIYRADDFKLMSRVFIDGSRDPEPFPPEWTKTDRSDPWPASSGPDGNSPEPAADRPAAGR